MAAQYAQHNYTFNQPQTPIYPSQEPSPTNSTSPTSPRMTEHLQHQPPNPHKQLRPLKSPLYVPAVLRPTEHFPKVTPMTPPKSLGGSLDSLKDQDQVEEGIVRPAFHLDLSELDCELLQEEELGDVTGPPTRLHWKPDEASPNCDSAQCKSSFNIIVRRHHCRHCGHVFCSSHTARQIPLDQQAKFHPNGLQSRACDVCYRQFQRWDTARSIRRKNSQNSGSDVTDSEPPTPLAGPPGHRRIASYGLRANKASEQAAGSVPKDWHWSTF